MHLRFTVRDTLLTILRVNARPDRPDDGDSQAAALAAQNFADPCMGGVPDSGLQSRQYGARFRCYQTAFGLQRPCDEPVSPHIGTYDLYFTPDKKADFDSRTGGLRQEPFGDHPLFGPDQRQDKGVVMYEKYPLTVTARRTLLLLPGTR